MSLRRLPPSPTDPIRLVLPFAAGGATDLRARVLAEAMAAHLPQPILVENRAIAAARGSEAMARRMAEPGVGRILASPPEAAHRHVTAKVTRGESLLRGRITPAR